MKLNILQPKKKVDTRGRFMLTGLIILALILLILQSFIPEPI
jgi:hypothetical protein